MFRKQGDPAQAQPTSLVLDGKEERKIKYLVRKVLLNSPHGKFVDKEECMNAVKKYLKADKRYEKNHRRIDEIVSAEHKAMTTPSQCSKTAADEPKKATKQRMQWIEINPPKFDAKDVDDDSLMKIKQFYDKSGYFIIRNAASLEQRESLIRQMMLVLDNQGHKPEYKLQFKGADSELLSISDDNEWPQIWEILQHPLDAKTRKMVELGFPLLHQGFGATCSEELCHLKTAVEIRTALNLYKIAAAVTGTQSLWVDMNRMIQKLPTKGDEEFLHFDVNGLKMQPKASSIGGKLHLSGGSSFKLVEGTHTREFREQFIEHYEPLYTVKDNACKMTLNPDKDPLGLFQRISNVKLLPGDWIVWHRDLLHGVVKRPRDMPIDFGMYLGYMPAVDRPEYKEIFGVSEKDDRRRSFEQGVFPLGWPSLDKVRYVPHKYENFPWLMHNYLKRLRDDHPGRCTHLIKSRGQHVPWLRPVRFSPYVQPELDKFQKQVYGLTPWDLD